MNRQQRRLARRSGSNGDDVVTDDDGEGALDAALAQEAAPFSTTATLTRGGTPATARRATPRQFLHEVNVEMRKVAWPTRAETVNYATVVLVTLAVLMALIFGLDLGFSKIALYLFK